MLATFSPEAILSLIIQLLVPVVAIIGAVWKIGTRIEKMGMQVEAQLTLFNERFERINRDVAVASAAIAAQDASGRQGRKDIWIEIATAKERLTTLETGCRIRHNASPTDKHGTVQQ